MSDVFFEELSNELHNGVNEKGHPFRYITLATIGANSIARLCTVVLREVSKNLSLTIYTDSRSKKIGNLKLNDRISVLMYHPDKLLQLKIEGVAKIVDDTKRLDSRWKNIQSNSKRDYITSDSPSSEISNPNEVEYLEDEHFFAMIDINPKKIEYLKLKRTNHIRVAFEKESSGWKSTFLIP